MSHLSGRRRATFLVLALLGCHTTGKSPASAPVPPSLPGCDHMLTVLEAQQVPDEQEVCVAAYVVYHQTCPPCPQGYECEACLAVFDAIGDDPPPGGYPLPPNIPAGGAGLDAAAIGAKILVRGRWVAAEGFGRFFVVTDLVVLAPTPG